jgi:hypothetical protein
LEYRLFNRAFFIGIVGVALALPVPTSIAANSDDETSHLVARAQLTVDYIAYIVGERCAQRGVDVTQAQVDAAKLGIKVEEQGLSEGDLKEAWADASQASSGFEDILTSTDQGKVHSECEFYADMVVGLGTEGTERP